MPNENFATGPEEEYELENDLVAMVSDTKVRIVKVHLKGTPNEFRSTDLTILIDQNNKMCIWDYFGWGD